MNVAAFLGLLALLLAMAPTQAIAQPQGGPRTREVTTDPNTYSDGPVAIHLTGNWGGLRDRLHQAGVDFRADYISEIAGNPVGGRSRAVRYADQRDFGADLDLDKLGVWKDGRVHVTLNSRAGRSLSKDAIGNLIAVQEIYGVGQNFRLTELAFEQVLAGGQVNILLGRINTEADFAASPYIWDHSQLYCVFQTVGICGTTAGGLVSNSGYTPYPTSVWGGRIRAVSKDQVYAQVGAYEVNPTVFAASNGFKLSTSGATGVFIPVEVGWRPGHEYSGLPAKGTDGPLPGDYKIGAYYDTSAAPGPFKDIPGAPATLAAPSRAHQGRYGLYILADQQVYRDPANHKRGLAVFAGVEVGDAATSLYRVFAAAGLVYKGTFAGRDDDLVGFAVTDAEVNSRRSSYEAALRSRGVRIAGRQSREVGMELNYSAAVVPGINIQTALQYVINPGALHEIPNALVINIRTSVKF